ncbi:MAG TPA: metallophosphoesterase [Thermoanaerobaculia bacterium]|jgi:hypothetical protein|nr:metallophosphoesterase [Thermoanaerobaculia bacterium]
MLLLHLSDLHFGAHSRFKGEDLTRLGKAFFKDLEAARGSFAKGSRIDLVAVTGDIAESGKPTEFKEGELFLAALAGELGLDRRRFVFVPGNHDVSWPACKKVAADQEEEGFDEAELRKRLDAVKLGRYEEFLRSFYGEKDLAKVALPLGRGAYLYDFPDLLLSMAALSSCEKESHRPADHVGFLSREQAEALMGEWRLPDKSGRLKIVTVHHNPVLTVPANIAAWHREIEKKGLAPELAARYESDVVGFEGRQHLKAIVEDSSVQLVLHGHHHAKDEQSWDWRLGTKGRAPVLSAGSLSLNADKLPADEPLSVRLIELDTKKKEIRARSLIFDPRARTLGELRRGSFVPDPVEPAGYRQQLDLPPEFEPKKSSKATKRKVPIGSGPFVRSYRLSFGASFSRWDLAPVGVAQAGGAGKPIEAGLDDMYQPLRLAAGFDIDETNKGTTITPEDLLARTRPLAIRGAAGAGKTTWMRWTFRKLLNEDRSLPLMLVVRDLAHHWQSPGCRGAARSLVSFLDAWAAERMGTGWEGELRKALEARDGPRPVLLVDGWDEAGKLGEELREKLVGLLTKCPRMLTVVTSRPYGEGRPSHAEGFDVLDVQPLADGEIQAFANRFFRQCYGDDEVAATREAERFWNALERAAEPRALSRTALLLTMMLLISRSRPLPDKRHLLYDACIDNFLTALPDRKAEEGALLSHAQWRPEDSEERKRVVAALAFALQEEGYRSNSRSAIVRDWEGMAALLPPEWKTLRLGFLGWLAGPAGLLTDRADGTLAFTHLSFQEYLSAWHLNATVEGAEERIREFSRQENMTWWESLRLWAALIEKQSPERLEPVLEALSGGRDGLALVGTILADGLGSELRFEKWKDRWQSELAKVWIRGTDECAQSWAASHQEARRLTLTRGILLLAPGVSWLAWIRLRDFLRTLATSEVLPFPKSLVSRSVVEQIEGDNAPSSQSVAAGRILCSSQPIWPLAPLTLGLLHLWPGGRRLLGLRLQSAVAAGMSKPKISQLLRLWAQRNDSAVNEIDLAQRLAISLEKRLTNFLEAVLDLFEGSRVDHNVVRDLAHDFSRDSARYLVRYIANEAARDVRGHALYFLGQSISRSFAQLVATEINSALSRETDSAAGDLPDTFAADTSDEFARSERFSSGRVGARVVLAYDRTENPIPEVQLLSFACRLSLHPTLDSKCLDEALVRHGAQLDPLWPALARHLARQATPADRTLLTDIAQNPERRNAPFSWGLQFIVRGDVLFDDGSIATLDELCDEAGVPRLPYLEDLPEELEVDWDSPGPSPGDEPTSRTPSEEESTHP